MTGGHDYRLRSVSLYTQVLEADRGLLQVMVSASTSIEFLGAASKWLAQKDVVLRLIPEAVGASAAVLVDYESSEQTGTPTLRITAQEKARLVRKLEALFGNTVKTGPVAGERAAPGAAALLWGWLHESGWTAAVTR